MPRTLPKFTAKKTLMQEIEDFLGMNSTDHPTLNKPHEPTYIYNSYFRDGVLKKRNGTAREGDYLTSKHSEPFDATTKKDSAATTGDWTTDGTANLLTNTTNQLDTNTNNGYGTGTHTQQRHTCISSNGTIFASYNDTTNIAARKSTDGGATWTNLAGGAGETVIMTHAGTGSTNASWSIWIDSSDHIHAAYWVDLGGGDDRIDYKKLTYSGGNWTVGSASSVVSGSGGRALTSHSICMTSGGTIWIGYYDLGLLKVYVTSSTNGTSWSAGVELAAATGEIAMILNNDYPMAIYIRNPGSVRLWSREYNGTSWNTEVEVGPTAISTFSVTRKADNDIWLTADGSATSVYKYNGTSWSFQVNVSTASADIRPQIANDGTNIWVVWSKYEAANQYEVVFKLYNGTSWGDEIAVTSDNANNIYVNLPLTISGQTWMPIFWMTGTANPWSIKARCVQLSGVIQSTGYDSTAGSQTYTASVTSTAGTGGTVTAQYADSTDNSAWSAFGAISGLTGNRYIKFKLTLTTTNLATSPSVDLVEITYGGLTIAGEHSFTRNDGAKYLLVVAGSQIFVRESGTTWVQVLSGLTTNLRTTAATFGNFLMITNGTDAVKRFNGKTTTGTISVTNASATVTGSGTNWNTASNTNQLAVGGSIKLPNGTWYTIATVASDTSLTISVTYPGTTLSGQAYEAYGMPSLAGSPPTGKYIEVHRNHVFIAGNTTNPTRIQFSDVGDAVTWPAANTININTNDGSIITGLASFRDVLGIGKYDATGTKKSVSILRGAAASDFSVSPVTTEYGFVSQQAVAVTPNYVFFLDRFGIVATNFISFERVDLPIENIIDSLNQQYIQNSAAIYFDEKVFFSVPYNTSATNNYLLMYDLKPDPKGWSIHTGLNPSGFCIYTPSNTPVLYFGDQTAVSAIFQWDSGASDNGQPINWQIEFTELDFEDYFLSKRFKYLFLDFEPNSVYNITVAYALDGNTSYTDLSDAMALDAGADDVKKRFVLPGLSGSSIKIRLTDNSTNGQTSLAKLAVSAIPKRYIT